MEVLVNWEDMDWLWSTHLKSFSLLRLDFHSAVIHGNEDCPEKIELYKTQIPQHNSKPDKTFIRQEDLSYKEE